VAFEFGLKAKTYIASDSMTLRGHRGRNANFAQLFGWWS
jgi:hypothetical protein